VNALLFDPGSEMSFRMVLSRLCDDAALRAQLGARARRTIEERRFTWAHNAERISGLARGFWNAPPLNAAAPPWPTACSGRASSGLPGLPAPGFARCPAPIAAGEVACFTSGGALSTMARRPTPLAPGPDQSAP
jgi:hypothetical protein